MVTTPQLYWAAGFIDGEGSFIRQRACVEVTAAQKEEWPLLKLKEMFGGRIRGPYRGCFRWEIYGKSAIGIAMTLYPLLSPRRQQRIRELILFWRALGLRGSFHRNKTHCIRGHEFTPENIYKKGPEKHRECRTCRELRGKAPGRKLPGVERTTILGLSTV
jgi:hypothetical protein